MVQQYVTRVNSPVRDYSSPRFRPVVCHCAYHIYAVDWTEPRGGIYLEAHPRLIPGRYLSSDWTGYGALVSPKKQGIAS